MALCVAMAAWCVAVESPAAPAGREPGGNEQAERHRMAAERLEVERQSVADEQACRTRFAVNACVDAASRERRQALGKLRQQEILLDEAGRKERAAQRIQRIRGKVSRDDDARRRQDARRRAAAEQQRRSLPARTAPPAAPAAAGAARTDAARMPERESAAERAEAARKTADYEKRQARAQAHREAVERRNAKRESQGKKALPLPVPPAASAASGG